MREFAVVGSPIEHSLSPLLHTTAYREFGITDARYGRFEVHEGDLAAFLEGGPGRALDGLSVTMPGKPEAAAIASECDETTARLGVANTLLRLPDGSWRAENHDVYGIRAALAAALAAQGSGRDSVSGPTTGHRGGILGSGATAACAVLALADLGVTELLLSARTPAKLAAVQKLAADLGMSSTVVDFPQSHEVLDADLVVSALAIAGAQAVAEAWQQRESIPVPGTLLDVLYQPWPAPIAGLVQSRGGVVVSGLEMLLHQAEKQLEAMVGRRPAPLDAMREAALQELARRP